METKEMSYNELVINGFMALFFNLVMLPALVFLNFLIFGQLPWLSIPVLFMLVLLFVLMLPGYFSQEPNGARVMVFFYNCIYNHRTTKTNQKYPSVNL